MSGPYRGDSKLNKSTEKENTKEGSCLLELRHSGMVQWIATRRYFLDQSKGSPQLSSKNMKDQNHEGAVTAKDLALAEIQKRKRITPNKITEVVKFAGNQDNLSSKQKKIKLEASELNKKVKSTACKKENYICRWSAERYNQAEKNMLAVMKAVNAVSERPISRPALRSLARQQIGDTGLLDHLLKHINGKLAPGGTERFCRCCNTEGVMQYWLESPDLVKVKHEMGLPDPSRIPQYGLKANGFTLQNSACAGELTLLKEELAKLRSDMELLVSNNNKRDPINSVQDLQEFSKWRSITQERLTEISSSLSGMQEMQKEMDTWKSKIEQQLKEVSMSLNGIQASKSGTTLNLASEKWEDWFTGTNFNNIREEDFESLLESTDLSNVGQEASVKDIYPVTLSGLKPCSTMTYDHARELDILKEETGRLKRDLEKLLLKNVEVDQAIVSPDSSAVSNSKLATDYPLLFQEMFKEMEKWKAKMELQLLEVSDAVNTLWASRQHKPKS